MRILKVDRPVAAWITAGLLISIAYPFLGEGTIPAAVLYCSVSAATVVAILAGIRRNRPANSAGWYLFAAAGTLRLARRGRARDNAGVLDAAIIATGLGRVWWVFAIGPIAANGTVPLLAAPPAPTVALQPGRGHATLIGASALLVPTILFVQGTLSPADLSCLAIGLGAVVLFLLVLVLARMSGVVRQVQRQSRPVAEPGFLAPIGAGHA